KRVVELRAHRDVALPAAIVDRRDLSACADVVAVGPRCDAESATSGPAASWNLRQICAGSMPPVTLFIGLRSSLPTHTPTTNESLKPTNQASRKFSLVPVLPAAKPSRSAARPVPRSTTPASRSVSASRCCCRMLRCALPGGPAVNSRAWSWVPKPALLHELD